MTEGEVYDLIADYAYERYRDGVSVGTSDGNYYEDCYNRFVNPAAKIWEYIQSLQEEIAHLRELTQ